MIRAGSDAGSRGLPHADDTVTRPFRFRTATLDYFARHLD